MQIDAFHTHSSLDKDRCSSKHGTMSGADAWYDLDDPAEQGLYLTTVAPGTPTLSSMPILRPLHNPLHESITASDFRLYPSIAIMMFEHLRDLGLGMRELM